MKISKILVSQPKPTSEKSPYYDLESKYGVKVVFRPFIKVEGLSSKEFRKFKVNPADFTAVIFTTRTAVDHYFRLAKELRFDVPDTMKYFCQSQAVAHYLQKYIQYRKRKIFYTENGKVEELITIVEKHKKEKFIFPMSDVHDIKTSLLDDHQIKYTPTVMYRTVSNDFEPGEPFDYDMIILFTPSGIKSLLSNFPNFVQGDIAIGGMGPKTIEEIKSHGLRLDITTSAKAPSIPAAIDQFLAKAQREELKKQAAAEKLAAEQAKKRAAKKAAHSAAPEVALSEEEKARLRSEAAKKAAATRAAKRAAEAEKARRRSEAAKKAAATRAAMRAEAARIAAEKAEQERIAAEQAAAERARRRSEAAKKAAVTRAAKRAAEAEKLQKRREAAKKAAATRAAKREEAARLAAEKAAAELARRRSEAAKKAAATRAAKRAAEAEKKTAKKATPKPAAKKATPKKK